jgi:hypothetical protein
MLLLVFWVVTPHGLDGDSMVPRNVGIYLQVHTRHNPEQQHRRFHCRENLRSHVTHAYLDSNYVAIPELLPFI